MSQRLFARKLKSMLVPKEFVKYYYWWVGALVLLGAMILHIWQRPVPLRNLPIQGDNFVVLGDDIAAGLGASTPDRAFVAQLESILGKKIQNWSAPAQSTYHLLERFGAQVANIPVNVLIIVLGDSDGTNGIPHDTSLGNFTKLVMAAQRAGIFVVFVDLDPPEEGWRFRHYESYSRGEGVLYIGKVMEGVWGNSNLLADPRHPNDRGHRIVAERVAAALKPYLLSNP